MERPKPQRQMKSQEFPISYLYDKRAIFDNYPDYQREKVWERGRKQLLINSIFNGLPIPPIIARKLIGENGEPIYELIDGQQRFTAICDFRDGAFATATDKQMRRLEPTWEVIEPGKTYDQISVDAKYCFNDFHVLLYSSSDIDMVTGSQIYRNLQKGKRLTLAQNLKSYYSKMIRMAQELTKHSFWSEIYVGPKLGEEPLRGAIHVLLMQVANNYIPQDDRNLRDFSCGLKDDLASEDLLATCCVHLDLVSYLFSKSKINQPYEVIPLYQAVLFLQKAGHSLDHLEKATFLEWFTLVQAKAYRNRYQGGGSTFVDLERMENQRYFWQEHLPVLESLVQQKQRVTT